MTDHERIPRSEFTQAAETQLSAEQVLEVGAELLQHFEVEVSPIEQPEEFVKAMDQLNPRFQGERPLVRFELEQDQTEWPEETKEVIMRAAEGMRMLEPETHRERRVDAIIVLGGARQSNLDRLRYARSESHSYRDPAVVIVGSSRKLNDAEKENVANYAPTAETEFDLCVAAAGKYAGTFDNGVQLLQVNREKAGTPDVIDAAMRALVQNGVLKDGKYAKDLNGRVAAVTTQIYQASTQLDLERIAARYNIERTETMGNPSDPEVAAKRTPATYLSEVLRTLKAATNNIDESNKEAKREENERKSAEEYGKYHDDPANWEILHASEDGSQLIEDPSGDRYVIEKDGRKWIQYSSRSGLQYDGPDDLVGMYPE